MKTKRIIAMLIVVMTIFTAIPVCAQADTAEIKGFSDVSEKRWSHEYIMICAEKGAVNGTVAPDENGIGKFDPSGNVTVGQFLAVITRLVCPELITDVPGQIHWSHPYFKAAQNAEIIPVSWKWPETKEFLNSSLKREDMALVLYNAAKLNGETLEYDARFVQSVSDYYKVSWDRQDAVLASYSNGLITGFEDGSFRPEGTMTREQMAAVVCRLMEYTERPDPVSKTDDVSALYDMDYYRENGEFSREDSLKVAKEILSTAKFVNNNGYLAVSVTFPELPSEVLSDMDHLSDATFGFQSIAYDSGNFFLYTWYDEDFSPGNTYVVDMTELTQLNDKLYSGGFDEDTKIPFNSLKRHVDTIYLDIWMPDVFGYTIRIGSDWGGVVGMNSSVDEKDFTFDFNDLGAFDIF